MKLRVLKYFLMVAREENITKAAQQLHITQPTLSRQLANLEDELGVKLFKRRQHSISLTEEGMLLRRRAQEIIELSNKTERELSHIDTVLSGEIAFGSGETKNIHVLIDMMVQFRIEHPDVTFDMYTAMADDIKERIDRGIIDFGILMEPVDISQYHFLRLPGREATGFLVREDSPLAEKETISPEDLVGTPLIIVKRPNLRNQLANWFGGYYEQMDIVSTYNLIYNAAIMVKNNVGAAMCIDLESKFDGLCFRPLSPAMETGSVLVWKKEQTLPAVAKAFISYVEKCLYGMSEDRN